MAVESQMSRSRLCIETKSLAIIPQFSNRKFSRENSSFRDKHLHYIGVLRDIPFAHHKHKLHNTCWRQPCCKTICHVSVDDSTDSLPGTSCCMWFCLLTMSEENIYRTMHTCCVYMKFFRRKMTYLTFKLLSTNYTSNIIHVHVMEEIQWNGTLHSFCIESLENLAIS
jgi:hypothetical protein